MTCPYTPAKVCPEKEQTDCGSCPTYKAESVNTEEEFGSDEPNPDDFDDDDDGEDDEEEGDGIVDII